MQETTCKEEVSPTHQDYLTSRSGDSGFSYRLGLSKLLFPGPAPRNPNSEPRAMGGPCRTSQVGDSFIPPALET